MRYAPRAILAGGLGFAASFVVACGGGSGLLSSDQSNALSSQADAVASAVQQGNCGAADNASNVLNNDVQTLPVTINSTLRSNLTQAASTIAQLAERNCHQQTTTPPPTTASTPTTTTTTSSSTSTSTSTTTTTPTTTTTSTTTSSATTPTNTGTTSTTTGGVGVGGGPTTTTDGGNGNSGGTGPGNGNSNGPGGGG
jgi:Tfp pilus assembly protein PilE